MKVGLNKITKEEFEKLFSEMKNFDGVTHREGQRVRKVMKEDGDVHDLLSEGTVVGGMNVSGYECYLVNFDENNGTSTFIVGNKIEAI
jgi:hypothetical protein